MGSASILLLLPFLSESPAEQTAPGTEPPARLVASFDGLGFGFEGPQGTAPFRNPSDNTLAVGREHVFQIVNSRMAILTKAGRPLYGPVPTNTLFRGAGGGCETYNNGDAVVRYDQLADRWLVVMPTFRRGPTRPDVAPPGRAGGPATLSLPGRPDQPGAPVTLLVPSAPATETQPPPRTDAPPPSGPYSMCYAVSETRDPLGRWYRYEFLRPLFPDYPRPAVWADGYYVPTSTSDDRISPTVATQKHACVAERSQMLKGKPARELCFIVENVNFLNNADLDGTQLPPRGAPNIMMAAGGRQLDSLLADSVINVWQFHVDWKHPERTSLTGPVAVPVSPYQYLCGGQLTKCVPQPGTEQRLDSQGDKLMARLVYRRIGKQESILATHSIATSSGGGGVRWYEFRVRQDRVVSLHQQGTYLSDGNYRWMASGAIDKFGNIGIGYSFGGTGHFPGQRFTGRRPGDRFGELTFQEAILVEGEAAQVGTPPEWRNLRWQDYTQAAVDPADDCTIWYVGDYLKQGATGYSTRIGAFRMPGCR
jgi:hypothetical protein